MTMEIINTIATLVVGVGALGWVGTTIVGLVKAKGENLKERAEATDVNVGSLLKIIKALEERIQLIEAENFRLRTDNLELHALIAELKAEIQKNKRLIVDE